MLKGMGRRTVNKTPDLEARGMNAICGSATVLLKDHGQVTYFLFAWLVCNLSLVQRLPLTMYLSV